MLQQHISELEECVVDAWPAAETFELDGWLLRATSGFSHRGNSVATVSVAPNLAAPAGDIDEGIALALRIARVEAWYAGRGLPSMFQVSPASSPKELDETLAQRGYRRVGESLVALITPEQLVEATPTRHRFEVSIGASASPAWLELGQQAGRLGEHPAAFQGVLRRLGTRCRYVLARDSAGTAVASCMLVSSEDRLGLHAMLTLPAARRRGAARALLHTVARAARGEAMREIYLLVEADNVPARALYQKSGFQELYAYHYRVHEEPERHEAGP